MCARDLFPLLGLLRINCSTIRSYSVRAVMESDDVVHLCLLCTSCAGRVEVCGAAPALDDGGLYRGIW